MNPLFLIISGGSALFFAVFFFQCAKPHRKRLARPSVRKIVEHQVIGSVEHQVIDSAVGRRFWVYVEQQMAEFISGQHRAAALLLTAIILLPISLRAQTSPTSSAASCSICADGSITFTKDLCTF